MQEIIHHQWLCITPMLNIVPLFYYWRYYTPFPIEDAQSVHLLSLIHPVGVLNEKRCKEKTNILTLIHFFTACLTISTILFWYSPIQHGIMHKIDKIIVIYTAFLTIGYMLFYTLFCKKTHRYIWFLYGIVLASCSYFLYLSNYYSSIEWCSRDHIVSHFWFHLFANPSIWFVFL